MLERIKNWFSGEKRSNKENDFQKIYEENLFEGKESVSGPGSDRVQTKIISEEIPKLLARFGVKTMIDAPCGDFFWMRHVQLGDVKYTGIDIVPDLVNRNEKEFATENRRFLSRDIVNDELPKADLIFCRDCLVHLTYEQAIKAIRNFRRSGSTYLLTTTFPGRINKDLAQLWRPLDLQQAPFSFPEPIALINEGCTENNGKYTDKSLGLWKLDDLMRE